MKCAVDPLKDLTNQKSDDQPLTKAEKNLAREQQRQEQKRKKQKQKHKQKKRAALAEKSLQSVSEVVPVPNDVSTDKENEDTLPTHHFAKETLTAAAAAAAWSQSGQNTHHQ